MKAKDETPKEALRADPPREAGEAGREESGEEEWYLPVYNGEVRPVRRTEREEITALLQLGMKQRDFLPEYELLREMAEDEGVTVREWVRDRADRHEKALLSDAVEKYGERDGTAFYEMHRQSRLARCREQEEREKAREMSEKQREASRWQSEFAELKEAVPRFETPEDVPLQVKNLALARGIPLLDAYHRFAFDERRRAMEEKFEEEMARALSTGPLSATERGGPDSAREAFLRGLSL